MTTPRYTVSNLVEQEHFDSWSDALRYARQIANTNDLAAPPASLTNLRIQSLATAVVIWDRARPNSMHRTNFFPAAIIFESQCYILEGHTPE